VSLLQWVQQLLVYNAMVLMLETGTELEIGIETELMKQAKRKNREKEEKAPLVRRAITAAVQLGAVTAAEEKHRAFMRPHTVVRTHLINQGGPDQRHGTTQFGDTAWTTLHDTVKGIAYLRSVNQRLKFHTAKC
jgi:hypothetical protein